MYRSKKCISQIRCGVAPLKIETGRYSQTPICERIYFKCTQIVEDEIHVLILYPDYQNIKAILFEKTVSLNNDFPSYEDTEKFKYLMSHADIVKYCVKACSDILYH